MTTQNIHPEQKEHEYLLGNLDMDEISNMRGNPAWSYIRLGVTARFMLGGKQGQVIPNNDGTNRIYPVFVLKTEYEANTGPAD